MSKFVQKHDKKGVVNLDLVAQTEVVPAAHPSGMLVRLEGQHANLGYCTVEAFEKAIRSNPLHGIANILRGIEESLDAMVRALDRIEAQMNEAGRIHDEERLLDRSS